MLKSQAGLTPVPKSCIFWRTSGREGTALGQITAKVAPLIKCQQFPNKKHNRTNRKTKQPPPLALNNGAVGLTQSWTMAAGCDFALERHSSARRTAGTVPPQNLKGRPVVSHWYKSNYRARGCRAESRSPALSAARPDLSQSSRKILARYAKRVAYFPAEPSPLPKRMCKNEPGKGKGKTNSHAKELWKRKKKFLFRMSAAWSPYDSRLALGWHRPRRLLQNFKEVSFPSSPKTQFSFGCFPLSLAP